MKNIVLTLAIFFGLTTTAFAEDFDNTGVYVSAYGEKFGVSLATGASRDFSADAHRLGIFTVNKPVNVGIQLIEEDGQQDYRVNASLRGEVPLGAFVGYGATEVHLDFGSSVDGSELLLSPYAGLELRNISLLVPFVELGYDFMSNDNNFLDFRKADSYGKVGARFSVTENVLLSVGVIQRMDADFDKVDREALVAFAVKF